MTIPINPNDKGFKMKCYQYKFEITWGVGQGIVVAEDEATAARLVQEMDSLYKPTVVTKELNVPHLNVIKLKEINTSSVTVIPMSWDE